MHLSQPETLLSTKRMICIYWCRFPTPRPHPPHPQKEKSFLCETGSKEVVENKETG